MKSASPLMADQLVDCIADNRPPTAAEVGEMAARIWIEGAAHRTAGRWDRLAPAAAERIAALRIAWHALTGGQPLAV